MLPFKAPKTIIPTIVATKITAPPIPTFHLPLVKSLSAYGPKYDGFSSLIKSGTFSGSIPNAAYLPCKEVALVGNHIKSLKTIVFKIMEIMPPMTVIAANVLMA